MGKVYLNQGSVKIELTYDELPSSYVKVWIKYKTPDDIDGAFPAEALHNVAGGSYYLIFPDGDCLGNYGAAGTWRFWLSFELADGLFIPGEPCEIKIYNEGC